MSKSFPWKSSIDTTSPPFDVSSLTELMKTLANLNIEKVFDEEETEIKISVGLKYLLDNLKESQNFDTYSKCVAFLVVLPWVLQQKHERERD